MTTKEIEQVFDIHNFSPCRVLKNDAEILDYIKNCVGIIEAFQDIRYVRRETIDTIKAEMEKYITKETQDGLFIAFRLIKQYIDDVEDCDI